MSFNPLFILSHAKGSHLPVCDKRLLVVMVGTKGGLVASGSNPRVLKEGGQKRPVQRSDQD